MSDRFQLSITGALFAPPHRTNMKMPDLFISSSHTVIRQDSFNSLFVVEDMESAMDMPEKLPTPLK